MRTPVFCFALLMLIYLTLSMLNQAIAADAFDATVIQIKTLKVELEQNQTSINEKQTVIEEQLSTLRENHDLNVPKGEFESDEDYAARLHQLNGIVTQRRVELEEEHLSTLLERRLEIQTEISRLHRRLFFTNDITATLGTYNANTESFPVAFEANDQSFSGNLYVNKSNAPNLKDNWDKVVKIAYLSIDPGYRRSLVKVKLEYPPLWTHGVTWTFDVVYDLGNNNSIAFSPDGEYLATGSNDEYGVATLWKVENGLKFRKLDHGDWVYTVAFSPNGKYFATAGQDETRYSYNGKAIVWDMNKGTKVQTIEHSHHIHAVAFSSNSKYLATAYLRYSYLGHLYLWRVQGGAIWGSSYRANGSTIQALTFRPDGEYLVTGNVRRYSYRLDGATYWRVDNGANSGSFEHKNGVYAVAFSPNGEYLATGNDGSVTLWELRSGRNIRQIDLPNTIVYAVTFSPDGEFLAIGKSNSYINIFRIGTEDITLQTEIPTVKSIYAGSEVRDLAWHPSGNLISDSKQVYRTLLEPILTDLIAKPLDTRRDVNRDGVVDVDDLVLVAANFGKSFTADANPNPDVNRDSAVDREDVIEIITSLEAAPRAPTVSSQTVPTLTAENLQRWINQAKKRNYEDKTFQRGIRALEQLLATLTQVKTVPTKNSLLPNYPNPFNPETWIPYHLAHAADVQITIYDTTGTIVRQLDLGHQPAGYYTDRAKAAYWDGRNANGELVASGVYFYQLRVRDYTAMRRLVIVK